MYDFTARHIRGLISLASGSSVGTHDTSTSKLVSSLLSNEVDEKLEPLRVTLMLNGDEFREGVFSWRGFLYYKWSMTNFWPEVSAVLKEVQAIYPSGPQNPDQMAYLRQAKERIMQAVRKAGRDVSRVLKVYDEAYEGLVRSGQPKAFRDFLLSALHLFLELGEKIGGISHVTSFWRYRFPWGAIPRADADELCAIFQDFESGFPPAQPATLAVAV